MDVLDKRVRKRDSEASDPIWEAGVAIYLSEEQRRAVAEQPGKAIEVIDPASRRTYLLVPADSPRPGQAGAGPSQGEPVTPGPREEGLPLRQRLADLPMPPEVAEAAKRHCKLLGAFWARQKRRIEDELKLQYYFGGNWVAYLCTREGIVVLAAAERLDDLSFDRHSPEWTPEERRDATLYRVSRFNDPVSEILTPFADEDQAGA